MIAEYFVVRTWRSDLDEANARGEVPAHAPEWVLAGLVAWAAGRAAGYFITAGIPALTSLVVAFVVYWAAQARPRPPRGRMSVSSTPSTAAEPDRTHVR